MYKFMSRPNCHFVLIDSQARIIQPRVWSEARPGARSEILNGGTPLSDKKQPKEVPSATKDRLSQVGRSSDKHFHVIPPGF
jgi:hypothetical protein